MNTYLYGDGNSIGEVDPLALWSRRAHNYFITEFIREAMPGLAGQYGFLEQIMAESAFADSGVFQTPEFAYMHGMSSSMYDPFTAQDMMCAYVKAYLNTYANMARSSSPQHQTAAYYFLGMALHPIMDMTSPEHRGFQYWPDGIAVLFPGPSHDLVDRSPFSNESLRHARKYRNETVELMKKALHGDLSFCGCQ